METETTAWSEFGKAIIEKILVSKKKKKNPKEQDCESHSQGKETFRAGKLTIWAMLFEIEEKLKQGSPELSVPPE